MRRPTDPNRVSERGLRGRASVPVPVHHRELPHSLLCVEEVVEGEGKKREGERDGRVKGKRRGGGVREREREEQVKPDRERPEKCAGVDLKNVPSVSEGLVCRVHTTRLRCTEDGLGGPFSPSVKRRKVENSGSLLRGSNDRDALHSRHRAGTGTLG